MYLHLQCTKYLLVFHNHFRLIFPTSVLFVVGVELDILLQVFSHLFKPSCLRPVLFSVNIPPLERHVSSVEKQIQNTCYLRFELRMVVTNREIRGTIQVQGGYRHTYHISNEYRALMKKQIQNRFLMKLKHWLHPHLSIWLRCKYRKLIYTHLL